MATGGTRWPCRTDQSGEALIMSVNLRKGEILGYVVYPHGGGDRDSVYVGLKPLGDGLDRTYPTWTVARDRMLRGYVGAQTVQEAVTTVRQHMCRESAPYVLPGRVVAVRGEVPQHGS
jgi:hypothetical protein